MLKLINNNWYIFAHLWIDRNGGWSEWGNWTECSVSCEGGTRMRTRLCNNPTREGAGANCLGDNTYTEECNTQRCPCMLLLFCQKDWHEKNVYTYTHTHTYTHIYKPRHLHTFTKPFIDLAKNIFTLTLHSILRI